MRIFYFNNSRIRIGVRTSSSLYHILLLSGIIIFTLSSCSANRGIRLRNKSIEKWEKKERKLDTKNQKEARTYSTKPLDNEDPK